MKIKHNINKEDMRIHEYRETFPFDNQIKVWLSFSESCIYISVRQSIHSSQIWHQSVNYFQRKDPSSFCPIHAVQLWKQALLLLIRIIGWSVLTNNLSLHFPPMKIPVAATGSARQRLHRALLPTCHEFSASIHRIPSNICSVILLALPIPHSPNHRRWSTAWAPPRRPISSHYHLLFLHQFLQIKP